MRQTGTALGTGRLGTAAVVALVGMGWLWIAGAGCTGAGDAGDDPDRAAFESSGCADLYAPDLLPTFELTVAPEEWQALETEFATWRERQAAAQDLKPEHPATFGYEGQSVAATVRLQANPSSSWSGDKMSFTVSFNKLDRKGRFHGLRKLVLHAQPTEVTLLRERLAASYFRHLGLPANCANNARLVVNGSYYGVYVNRERLDDEYLERVFPGAEDNDLWKGGFELENHDVALAPERHSAVMSPPDVAALAALADLEQAVSVWAAEAMLPDSDGYWAVNHNFYLYDHPTRGFLWLPYDLDGAFDFTAFNVDPVLWTPPWGHDDVGVHQALVLADPAWRARYREALGQALAGYDPRWLGERLERWSAQIRDAVADDPRKPFSQQDHEVAVQRLSGHFGLRQRFVSAWLECDASGQGEDGDGDGAIWCRDCDDRDPARHPAAVEICGNEIDENCNGLKSDCP
jgi:hypothetical protein